MKLLVTTINEINQFGTCEPTVIEIESEFVPPKDSIELTSEERAVLKIVLIRR